MNFLINSNVNNDTITVINDNIASLNDRLNTNYNNVKCLNNS